MNFWGIWFLLPYNACLRPKTNFLLKFSLFLLLIRGLFYIWNLLILPLKKNHLDFHLFTLLIISCHFSTFQLLSRAWCFATPWTAARKASLSITNSQSYSNSCSLSRWCHPAISSSVIPFSSCLQSFPASGSFQMSQLFTSGGQSIGVLPSTSVLPMNTQDWSPLGWTVWISLQSWGNVVLIIRPHLKFALQLSLPPLIN